MSRSDPRTRAGHLFIIDGDLTRLDCDALLVPTDEFLNITPIWHSCLGLPASSQWVRLEDWQPPAGWASDQRVARYSDESTRPQIWLGNIGINAREITWYSSGAVAFVEAAASALATNWTKTVPPRIAINVVGSGSGGMRRDKGVLFETLVPVLHDAAARVGVDVVLVTHGAKPYSAAQRARRNLERSRGGVAAQWAFDSERGQHQVADALAEHTRSKALVLFMGAGVSMGAGLPSWQKLLDKLVMRHGYSEDDLEKLHRLDVRDQAAIIAKRYGSSGEYQRALAAEFTEERHSLAHGLLASLGVHEAVTTNYDRLYERAVETDGRDLAVLPYEPVIGQQQWLLKLHGSLDRPDDIVLTRDDYLGLPERAGALFGILQAMLMTRHMLFVGYSLTDDTFYKVMHQVRRAKKGHEQSGSKLGTVLTLFDDQLLRELWGDELDIVALASRPVGTEADYAQASRQLDLFLDLVAFHSADVSAFLLDDTYASMLSDDEKAIADALRSVLVAAQDSTSPIAEQVKRRLHDLGVESWDDAGVVIESKAEASAGVQPQGRAVGSSTAQTRRLVRELSSQAAVLRATAEHDRLGRDTFLARYGFGRANEYRLVIDAREYDSKAIAGVAYGFQFPNEGPLRSTEFSGGSTPGAAAEVLERLGFEIRRRRGDE